MGRENRNWLRVVDVLVAVAHTLVTADLGILALTLLHQGLKLSIITLSDSLWLHLDCQVSACSFDAGSDIDNSLLQASDSKRLIQARAVEDVKRRRHQPDLDLSLLSVLGLGCVQSGLDSIDTVVAEAGDLNIGSDLGGLGCETLADVCLQLLGGDLVGEGDIVPHFRVASLTSS
ncbi:hypothetical protein HG531_006232 [Fusarium graminearum]|nr:hypothetical protein HG531_006232 [Fusarium graminearum]